MVVIVAGTGGGRGTSCTGPVGSPTPTDAVGVASELGRVGLEVAAVPAPAPASAGVGTAAVAAAAAAAVAVVATVGEADAAAGTSAARTTTPPAGRAEELTGASGAAFSGLQGGLDMRKTSGECYGNVGGMIRSWVSGTAV